MSKGIKERPHIVEIWNMIEIQAFVKCRIFPHVVEKFYMSYKGGIQIISNEWSIKQIEQ